MRSSFSRLLVRLYPSKWRTRYGQEFEEFLRQSPPEFLDLLNIVQCAIEVHLSSWMGDHAMHPLQRTLPLLSWAWLMAVIAGVNLCGSVDDNPLTEVMRAHGLFQSSWVLIEACSLVALFAIIAGGALLLVGMLKSANDALRGALEARLLIPVFTGILLISWVAGVLVWTRGHWIPMPWAVTGDWIPSPNWPSLHTRWILGVITLVLMLSGGIGSTIGFTQAVQVARFTESKHYFAERGSAAVVGVAILLMAVGTGLWGLFANQYAPSIFHARFGGLLNLSTFNSWILSFILFAFAAVISLRSASRSWQTTK